MIQFTLNGELKQYNGNPETKLLDYLRNHLHLKAAKDGCSGQGACGACMVEINGESRLSCLLPMRQLENKEIFTLEGVPEPVKEVITQAFVDKGAVQCGFCTPGFVMRTRTLFSKNPSPDKAQIRKALHLNLCRCTGYNKIVDAIYEASRRIITGNAPETKAADAKVGSPYPKYQALEMARGSFRYINDLEFPDMLYGALCFSQHPKAKVLAIDLTEAQKVEGFVRGFTATDIPGQPYSGLIVPDWPLLVGIGETTRYIGDVLAIAVARSPEKARLAASLIKVDYQILNPVTSPAEALAPGAPQVHPNRPNLLETCTIHRGGDAAEKLLASQYVASGSFTTQRIEHAFLETEAAIAVPNGEGIHLYSNGQGIYVDRKQVAGLLGINEGQVRVSLVSTGGGFGGKEDLTVQGHAAMSAFLLRQTVKVALTREESIRMHPKRHPVQMEIKIGCDGQGKLTALQMLATGDSGAYASVGTKVMERVAGHATGAYHFPCVNLQALTVYTNNIPSGAMRGFGANQAAFALESCLDDLCRQGGFDRWEFRFRNALAESRMTATGQRLGKGVGVRACLEALKPHYQQARFKGLACGIKNSGVGNGMIDSSEVIIRILGADRVEIHHGWTEMGQGVQTIAIQTLHHETGIPPQCMEVIVDTQANIPTGMTTSSRATALLGNAILDAASRIRADLQDCSLADLVGREYTGSYVCDWTTKPGDTSREPVTHFAYGYAAQLVVLDEKGDIETVYAAHDAGHIMNRMMFEGQIEGALHMGLGYALSEDLPMKDGQLISTRLRDLHMLRAHEMPHTVVIGVEESDPVGPYGAKGLGEIGLVPTAAAVANAFCDFDGIQRTSLPLATPKNLRTKPSTN